MNHYVWHLAEAKEWPRTAKYLGDGYGYSYGDGYGNSYGDGNGNGEYDGYT